MDGSRKLSVFIATSLDGYITAENESLDWLFQVEGEGDNGIGNFMTRLIRFSWAGKRMIGS